jgi:hypothetical protein
VVGRNGHEQVLGEQQLRLEDLRVEGRPGQSEVEVDFSESWGDDELAGCAVEFMLSSDMGGGSSAVGVRLGMTAKLRK